MEQKYNSIVKHYEDCLEMYGDNCKGVDWPNAEDAKKRYQIMLDIIQYNESGTSSILDFGCGLGHLYEYILQNNISLHYTGIDISDKFIKICKQKFPQTEFYQIDILQESSKVKQVDYIIMNGVFTEKCRLSYDEMFQYLKKMIKTVFNISRKGIAFNVMSKDVDWEREDLFHLSFSSLSNFLTKEITRDFIIRNDYGLYEYTVYLLKK